MSRIEFDAGLTLLRLPTPRSTVPHRLVGRTGREHDDDIYWIDARNTASTHALYDCASSRRSLADLQIARAFTAYQHHSLVRQVAREASPETAMILAPNVADLYRDDDIREWERENLFSATLRILRELGRSLDCHVIVTATESETAERIEAVADQDVTCIHTREGIRFDGDGVSAIGYHHGAYWQTTIPYWVDICGIRESITIDPVVSAYEQGVLRVSG